MSHWQLIIRYPSNGDSRLGRPDGVYGSSFTTGVLLEETLEGDEGSDTEHVLVV